MNLISKVIKSKVQRFAVIAVAVAIEIAAVQYAHCVRLCVRERVCVCVLVSICVAQINPF